MTPELAQELAQLRRWKNEALEVLAAWDACYDDLESVGFSVKLGESKPEFVHKWILDVLYGSKIGER